LDLILSRRSAPGTAATGFEGNLINNTVIYDAFKAVAEQTGASKIMHFKQPKLFIMWDTDIRRMHGPWFFRA